MHSRSHPARPQVTPVSAPAEVVAASVPAQGAAGVVAGGRAQAWRPPARQAASKKARTAADVHGAAEAEGSSCGEQVAAGGWCKGGWVEAQGAAVEGVAFVGGGCEGGAQARQGNGGC